MASEFRIQKEPVYDRKQLPGLHWGFTVRELAALAGGVFVTIYLTHNRWITAAVAGSIFGYVKYLKEHLPDNYVGNFISYHRRKHYTYLASARDTEWSPPVVPE